MPFLEPAAELRASTAAAGLDAAELFAEASLAGVPSRPPREPEPGPRGPAVVLDGVPP